MNLKSQISPGSFHRPIPIGRSARSSSSSHPPSPHRPIHQPPQSASEARAWIDAWREKSTAPPTTTTTTTTTSSNQPDVLIVGGGVAGLAAALSLQKAGLSYKILESSDQVGGRVRSDVVDGFILDRGFQIFLTSYPTARDLLDYDALALQPFYAGADVFFDGQFHRVADPFRHFADGINSLTNPIGTVADKLRVGVFRLQATFGTLDELYTMPETTTIVGLRAEGFSEAIIQRFFRPFLGGIFFDTELNVSSRLFRFVMRMLATGENCLPSRGIGAVASVMKARVGEANVKLNHVVTSIDADQKRVTVRAAAGTDKEETITLSAKHAVLVAVPGPEAQRLLGTKLGSNPSHPGPGVGTACVYFAADSAPNGGINMLYLNGTGHGLVNNCCFPSTVAPSYAPPGKTLVSASTVGIPTHLNDESLAAAVKTELSSWFGEEETRSWKLLRVYRIPFAQPSQSPPTNLQRPVQLTKSLYVCGDHRDAATLEGALRSGQRAAEAVIASIQLL